MRKKGNADAKVDTSLLMNNVNNVTLFAMSVVKFQETVALIILVES